jgi:dihydrofolate reductase
MSDSRKTVTLIAALASNGAIGLAGKMPWHLPGELKHFKEATMGKPIVMGRKTWESIGRPLPGRHNIIVTRDLEFQAEGCDVVRSLEEAFQVARGLEVMIIGGGQLYAQAMSLATRMILTEINHTPEADTWFPEWDRSAWQSVGSRSVPADAQNPFSYTVQEFIRSG